jgi:hypothetical protein
MTSVTEERRIKSALAQRRGLLLVVRAIEEEFGFPPYCPECRDRERSEGREAAMTNLRRNGNG